MVLNIRLKRVKHAVREQATLHCTANMYTYEGLTNEEAPPVSIRPLAFPDDAGRCIHCNFHAVAVVLIDSQDSIPISQYYRVIMRKFLGLRNRISGGV